MTRRQVAGITTLITFASLMLWVVTLPAGAHDGAHGDCNSNDLSGTYEWRLTGTSADDICDGHDTGVSRDDIETNGGQDRIDGQGGADRVRGDVEADNLFGGINSNNREYVYGGPGGGTTCDMTSGSQRCEKVRGGNGPDDVHDTSGLDTGDNEDYDWLCDGEGQDEMDALDGDSRDVLDCLCDTAYDESHLFFDFQGVAVNDFIAVESSCSV